ncbi:MAG: hypothetical protein ACYDC1_24400 [Limisphaerales bacterium]
MARRDMDPALPGVSLSPYPGVPTGWIDDFHSAASLNDRRDPPFAASLAEAGG